jgi:cell division protein FtsI/penicillin-binding protein 2
LQNENVKTVFARYKADAKGVGIKNSDTEIFDDGYNENSGVYLSIDGDIQRLTEEILKEKMETGAVVVQDINTAEILSCVSMPTYNISDVAAYLDSDKGELLNRAFLGYTPGSVFKTIVSASALEKDISLVDREYECRGYIEVSGNIISCHKKEGHGKIKMREAFSVSCNPYFISLVLETGVADVIESAKKMGVSKLSDLDGLPLSKGVLPEGELCGTDVANTAVGQGKILLNPIEMNSVMICAATGYYKEPTLVSKLVFEDGREEISERKKEKVLSEYTVATLRSMLFSCVNSGTGYRAKNENILCAGKTATAQSGQIKNGKEVIHSWFSGYFPADEPKYVITVLCDGNGENNYHPTLIFKEIAEKIAKKEES